MVWSPQRSSGTQTSFPGIIYGPRKTSASRQARAAATLVLQKEKTLAATGCRRYYNYEIRNTTSAGWPDGSPEDAAGETPCCTCLAGPAWKKPRFFHLLGRYLAQMIIKVLSPAQVQLANSQGISSTQLVQYTCTNALRR
jgi:hypothetical protein